MEMIAEKAALLSTHDQEEDIPRLTSDQPSPNDEIRDPGLSIITPGENNVDPLSNSNSTSTSTKMSEKARGKMRAIDPSTLEGEDGMGMVDVGDEELLGIAAAGVGPSGYVPNQEWVSSWQKGYVFFCSFFLSAFPLFFFLYPFPYKSPLPSCLTPLLPLCLLHVPSTIHDSAQPHQLPRTPSLH